MAKKKKKIHTRRRRKKEHFRQINKLVQLIREALHPPEMEELKRLTGEELAQVLPKVIKKADSQGKK